MTTRLLAPQPRLSGAPQHLTRAHHVINVSRRGNGISPYQDVLKTYSDNALSTPRHLTTAPGPSSRRYRMVLAAILAACSLLGVRTLTDSPPRLDGLRYFALAHNIAVDGIYSYRLPVEGPPVSDNRLEPLYSAILVPGVAMASHATGEDLECFVAAEPECATWLKWLKLPNVAFYVLSLIHI